MIPTKRIQLQQKPKAAQPVVDDWEQDEADAVGPTPAESQKISTVKAAASPKAPPLDFRSLSLASRAENAAPARTPDEDNRSVWNKANASSPATQGVILLRPSDAAVGGVRVLPPAALGQASGLSDGGVPKILRRDPASSSSASSGSSAGRAAPAMTLEEREKKYAEARARIFGTTSATPSPAASEAGGDGPSERGQQRKRRGDGARSRGGRGGGASGSTSASGSGRNSPNPSSERASPAPEQRDQQSPQPPRERSRAADGQRQPLGPQEGGGFAPRR